MSSNFADRVRLLMEYDTSLTSVENKSKIIKEDTIVEQFLAPLIKSGFAGTFDDIMRSVKGGLKNTNNVAIKNLDDLILNIEKGTMSPAMMGQVRRGLLRTGKITPALQSQLIDDLLEIPGVVYKGGSTQKAVKESYKMLGYSDEVAEEISKKVMKLRKAKPKVAPKVTPETKPSPEVIAKAKVFFKSSNWEAYKKWGIRLGIPVGLLALAWYLASGEDVSDPEVDNDNSGGGGGSGSGFRDCNSLDFLSQGCKSEKIRELQTCIGFKGKDVDGIWGPKTQERMRQLGLHTGILVADIESICKTYNELNKTKETQQTNQRQTQDSQSINYFTGEEPYASYDGESVPSNVPSEITGSGGPTANY